MLKTILLTNQIQNRQYLKDLQRLIAKFDKNDLGPRKNKKVDLNCSNRYETLSVTVINPESEREDSVDVTITEPRQITIRDLITLGESTNKIII